MAPYCYRFDLQLPADILSRCSRWPQRGGFLHVATCKTVFVIVRWRGRAIAPFCRPPLWERILYSGHEGFVVERLLRTAERTYFTRGDGGRLRATGRHRGTRPVDAHTSARARTL